MLAALDTLLLYYFVHTSFPLSCCDCGHQRCSDKGDTWQLYPLASFSFVEAASEGSRVQTRVLCCSAFLRHFSFPDVLAVILIFVCVTSVHVVPSSSTLTLRNAGSFCGVHCCHHLYIHFCVHATGVQCDVQCEDVSEKSGFGIYNASNTQCIECMPYIYALYFA